jgi:hypothetical protein
MTETTIQKLEQAFLMGCTDQEACLYADIVPSTLYNYTSVNPEFLERKETLKQNPVMKARGILLRALDMEEAEDASPAERVAGIIKRIEVAHKVIDRKEGSKVAVTGADGGPIEVTRIERVIVKS